MTIDDMIPTVDSLWGKSIDKYIRPDRVAATTANRAFTSSGRDTSASELAIYDQPWHDRIVPKVKNRLFITEMFYRASNERYDKLFGDLHRLPDEQLDAANSGSPLTIFRMLEFEDLSILASTAKNWFSD